MRVLVDATHPAHVHLFRHAVADFESAGDEVAVVSREKDVTTDLLDAFGVDHAVLSRRRGGTAGLLSEWVAREARLLRFARRFAPDVVLSRLNPAAAHVSALLDVPNVVFHDTEIAGPLARVTCPFVDRVCTPDAFDAALSAPQVTYEGFQELAYLHPDRFTPDPAPLRDAGVDPEDPYAVVRFVGMDAHHDAGHDSFSLAEKRRLVARLSERGDVYVSSEASLPDDLAGHAVPVAPAAMHDLLAFADCYVGDSGTMAAEAGLLGTPAVRFDAVGGGLGNFDALGARGLVVSLTDPARTIETAANLAADPKADERWARRRRRLLGETVDVTDFMVEQVREAAR